MPQPFITPQDIAACARGNRMHGMSPAQLRALITLMQGKSTFAARVTRAAAAQMLAARLRMGAR